MKASNKSDPVAIVGMGIRFPGADDVESFWRAMEEKKDLTQAIPKSRFNTEVWCSKEKVKGSSISHRGSFLETIKDFDAPFFNLSLNEARELDPQIRILLEAAWFAIEDAGLVLDQEKNDGGVFIGHMTHDYMEILDYNRYTVNSHCMQGNAETMAANRLSYFFNLNGPSETCNTACSSSLVAVHNAVKAIQNGDCSWAISGGANALLDPRYFVGFTDWGTMSADGHCYSFDSRANGYVRSEGAGVLVLKKLSDAIRDHDRVYAVIRGSGVNHDGNKPAITNPRSATQQLLIEKVCRESDTDPLTVSYIEAHGTGTVAGDKTEAKALGAGYCAKKRDTPLYIGSLKSNYGHMEGAAGVAGLMKAALCVYHGRIPASIKVEQLNPDIKWKEWQLEVVQKGTPFPTSSAHPRRAAVNSFGIGGTNAHVIVEEVSDPSASSREAPSIMTLFWSGKTEAALHAQAKQLLQLWKSEDCEFSQYDICWTLLNRRNHLEERASIVGTSEQIEEALSQYASGALTPSVHHSTALNKSFRPIVFVFCGQGSQWQEMGLSCMNTFPIFKEALLRCTALVQTWGQYDLLDKIKSNEVNSTRISQPAITAIQIALVELLKSWSITPSAVVGHSSGEIAAAYAAGAITFEEAMCLAYYRGSSIADLPPANGGMAAIGLSPQQAQQYISKYASLVIACHNSPSSLTISGSISDLEQLKEDCKKDGVFYRALVVTHAFHSPFIAGAMDKYYESIQHIHGKKLLCPFFSTLKGKKLNDGSELDAHYFVENLTHPVLFPQALSLVEKSFNQAAFVEVGPHPALHGPILQCLSSIEGIKTRVIATFDRRVEDVQAIHRCVASLYTCGVDVTLSHLHPKGRFCSCLPHYPFDRRYMWFESEKSYRLRNPLLIHPVLGVSMPSPTPTWERILDIETIPWIRDHKVSDSILAPGALYLDTALAATKALFDSDNASLFDCSFLHAYVLPEKGPIHIRTTGNPETGEICIYHRDHVDDVEKTFIENESARWTLHFRCYGRAELDESMMKEQQKACEWIRSQCTSSISIHSLYHTMFNQGLQFGPAFKTLETVAIGENEGLCSIKEDALGVQQSTREKYVVHPVLLDTVFQGLITILADSIGGCIPIGMKLMNCRPGALNEDGEIELYVQKSKENDISNSGDVWMMKGSNLVLWCRGIQVAPLSSAAVKKEKVYTTIQYVEKKMQAKRNVKEIEILDTQSSSELMQQCKGVFQCRLLKMDDESALSLNQPNSCWLLRVTPCADTLISSYTDTIYPWVKILIQRYQLKQKLPPIVFLTEGGSIDTVNPSATSLHGMARALHTECPDLTLWMIDLDLSCPESLATTLKTLVDSLDDGYQEIMASGGYFYSPAVTLTKLPSPSSYQEPKSGKWRIVQGQEGSLESFHRTENTEKPLGDDDILFDVHYVGLNYKDVMIAVGLLKEDAFAGGRTGTMIGLEGSGIVRKVGKNVTQFKEGDSVFGLLDNGIATESVSEACFCCKKPDSISMQDAASLFVPYTTAYATIVDLGKTEKGMIVMIHGAAGGVGSAAVQLASSRGAIVIATVSNKKKEDYVRKLGAQYVFNSRKCDFVNEVMAVTNNRGCDLILNCISGRAMHESVRSLAKFGTFIEIGKTDAMGRKSVSIHDLLNNGTYIFFDMDRYFARRDICVKWIQSMLQEVVAGRLMPPPVEVFTLNNMAYAIRKLSAAKHIGKIVLQLCNGEKKLLSSCYSIPFLPHLYFSQEKSYLLIGGTGGLGVRIAEWMIQHGANSIVLLSRRGKVNNMDEVLLKRMRRCKAEVSLLAVDACDETALEAALDAYQKTHPPIMGVIHSAMVLRDGLISNLSRDDITQSLSVKVKAGWNVHNYCINRSLTLDFFIALSSISSIIGNLGQSNYCIGNCSLEGLISHRKSLGLEGNVINLAGVYNAGAIARDLSIINASIREEMISYHDVCDVIAQVAQHQRILLPDHYDNDTLPTQIILYPFSASRKNTYRDTPILKVLMHSLSTTVTGTEGLLKHVNQLSGNERSEYVATRIKQDIATILGVEESHLKSDQPLSSLGVDSILAVELKNKLDSTWHMSLPVFELTSGKNIGELIQTVLNHVSNTTAVEEKEYETMESVEDIKLWSVSEILQRSPRANIDSTSHATAVPKSGNYEKDIFAMYNQLKGKIQVKTDYAEAFDWTNTREALETKVYLSNLPWNPYFFTQNKKTPTVSDIDSFPNCVNFTTYDYLGLCSNQEVITSAQEALSRYGTSVSASRLAGGQIPLHKQLESKIASFLNVEDSIVMLGGHTCNVNTIKCLMSPRDLILYDALAHNSIIEGAAYSGASRIAFRHNDYADLERILIEQRCKFEKVLICIEGAYSMDGDIPNLPAFIRVKQQFNCILYVDEAHSIGVLGDSGRGIGEYYHINMKHVDLWMGSLGKALASAGGYIAGSAVAIEILRYRSPGFVYSIGMTPSAAASALMALEVCEREPWRIKQLHQRTDLFKALCKEKKIDIYDCEHSCSAVIPVKCGSTERCIEVMRLLRAEGVLVSAGMYPAVKSGDARLRFFISANHTEEEIHKTVTAVNHVLSMTSSMYMCLFKQINSLEINYRNAPLTC